MARAKVSLSVSEEEESLGGGSVSDKLMYFLSYIIAAGISTPLVGKKSTSERNKVSKALPWHVG